MKLRRLSIMCALVVLAMAMVVVPVSAGKVVTDVKFHFTEVPDMTGTIEYPTGKITHLLWLVKGPVTGDALVTGELNWEINGKYVWPNAHSIDWYNVWMPCTGKWRLEVAGGGWEGSLHVSPWIQSEQWPKSTQMLASGTGFGQYTNTQIKWSLHTLTPWDATSFVFEGQISENAN